MNLLDRQSNTRVNPAMRTSLPCFDKGSSSFFILPRTLAERRANRRNETGI
jgi:hypothetical protein